MKTVSIVHLLVVCAANLAASQVASPHFGDDVAKSMPVPAGWHIVAFTSPKGADSMPDKDGAAPPGQTVLNDLNAPTDAEAAAEALAAKGPQEDNELAEALGSSSQPAEPSPVALSEAPPAESANTETVDGLQIPSGYRVQGLTPAAAAPEAPAVGAPTEPAAADNDQLPVPAGYRIEGLTPAAEAVASTPPTVAASQKLAPPAPTASTATGAVASSPDLKVDGLQVPAGWKITSIVDDNTPDAASDSPAAMPPPKPQALATKAQVANPSRPLTKAEQAGIAQFKALKEKAHVAGSGAKAGVQGTTTAVSAAATGAYAGGKAGVQGATAQMSEAALGAIADAKERKRLVEEQRAAEERRQKIAATTQHKSFGEMIKARTQESMRAGGNDPDTGIAKKSAGTHKPLPAVTRTKLVEAPPASLRGPVDGLAPMPEGSVIDKVLNIVHPVNTIAPYVPVVALGHITSVDCLTETLDNGGRPCKSEYEKSVEAKQARLAEAVKAESVKAAAVKAAAVKAEAVKAEADASAPKAKRTLLTKGSVHREQSITKVNVVHHHVDVTEVISREPATTEVVHHEHRHHSKKIKQDVQDVQPSVKASMADLIR